MGKGREVLDIGCSSGTLLDYAKAKGAATAGVDPSAACGELVTAKGHRFATTLTNFVGQRFDVITAFDVVEHIYNLSGFFDSVAHLMKPGGVLVILTGDVDCMEARFCGSRWWYSSYPEHVVFPSRRFFASRPAGLRLQRTVRTYASLGYRVPLRASLWTLLALTYRGKYAGLPSLGPDHLFLVLRHE
jgi:SAM-dependent methyltransferase